MKSRKQLVPIGLLLSLAFVALPHRTQAQDPLNSWGVLTVPGFTTSLSSIEYGNGVFVAVGANSTVARSSDGANWTISSPGTYGDFGRIRFLNGEFHVVGSGNQLLTSDDGEIWTATTLPVAGSTDVAYGNGTYVLAGYYSFVSPNGIDWTPTFPKNTVFGVITLPANIDSIIYWNGRFVGQPVQSTAFLGDAVQTVYSSDGVNWVQGPDGGPEGGGGELVFNEDRLLGAASAVSSLTNGSSTWCCGFFGFSDAGLPTDFIAALAYGAGSFLCVATRPTSPSRDYYSTSTDGVNWQARTNLTVGIRGAAFGNGRFVAVGDSGLIVQSGDVSGAPSIISQPQDQAAIADNPASFSVSAAGAQPLVYQWYHGSNAISGATSPAYNIAHVATADGGTYFVTISNSLGSVTSRVTQLTVAFLDIGCYAGLKVIGTPGKTYRIEATPTVGTPNWQVLTHLVLPSSPHIWIDYDQ